MPTTWICGILNKAKGYIITDQVFSENGLCLFSVDSFGATITNNVYVS